MAAQGDLAKLRGELVTIGKQRLGDSIRQQEDVSHLEKIELGLLEANQKLIKLGSMSGADRPSAYAVLGGDSGQISMLESTYKELVLDKARRASRATEVENELRELASRVIQEGEKANETLAGVEVQLADQTAARIAAEDAAVDSREGLDLAKDALSKAEAAASMDRMALEKELPQARSALIKAKEEITLLQKSNALTNEIVEATKAQVLSEKEEKLHLAGELRETKDRNETCELELRSLKLQLEELQTEKGHLLAEASEFRKGLAHYGECGARLDLGDESTNGQLPGRAGPDTVEDWMKKVAALKMELEGIAESLEEANRRGAALEASYRHPIILCPPVGLASRSFPFCVKPPRLHPFNSPFPSLPNPPLTHMSSCDPPLHLVSAPLSLSLSLCVCVCACVCLSHGLLAADRSKSVIWFENWP